MTADQVKKAAADLGFMTCGIAQADSPQTIEFYRDWVERGFAAGMDYLKDQTALKETLESLMPGTRCVIACSMSYAQPNPKRPGYPRIAQYALGRDYHKVLRGRLRRLAEQVPGKSRVCVDSAPLLEREWAHRAGLGWFGKNTMLIDSKRGSLFVLGFLLTDQELEPDQPSQGGCGTCRACIDACPTDAIVQEDGRWQVDARHCISYWTIEHKGPIPEELASQFQGWTFGCDICQEVCPFNQPRESQPLRAALTTIEDFRAREWPPLEELKDIGQEEWDALTQGSPVRRCGHEGLKRNARISLKNASDRDRG